MDSERNKAGQNWPAAKSSMLRSSLRSRMTSKIFQASLHIYGKASNTNHHYNNLGSLLRIVLSQL